MSNKQFVNDILDFDINKAPPSQDMIDHAVSLGKKRLTRVLNLDKAFGIIIMSLSISLLALLVWGLEHHIPVWMYVLGYAAIPIALVVGWISSKNDVHIKKLKNQIEEAKPASSDRLKKLLELLSERPEYLKAIGEFGRAPVEGEVSKFIDFLEKNPHQENFLSLCRKVCGFDDEAEVTLKKTDRDQHNAY